MNEIDSNQIVPRFETYQQTVDYLFHQLPMYWRIGDKAYKPGLASVIALCNILNNPQNSFKSIHIAGTNGKGSTSHMLASILQHAGYRTGLYTSPHLKDFRERIKINGQMIPEQVVIDFVNQYHQRFSDIEPSFFVWTMALTFKYFADMKVDIAIIEAGVGGRLDSTNIINPELSIITNIGMDHVQILGNTLESIAFEKAGIIKSNTPVVIGEMNPETADVFKQKTKQTSSNIRFAPIEYSIKKGEKQSGFLELDIDKNDLPYLTQLKLDLTGSYQNKNILTVLCAVDELQKQNWKIPEQALRRGLSSVVSSTGLQGRWQILAGNPLTICDVGHNAHGLKEVVKQITQTPFQNLHIVFGMVNDKDSTAVLELLPKTAKYYFCNANLPRALNAEELKIKAHNLDLVGDSYSSVKSALAAAQAAANPNDLIFIGGSVFVVAEIL